jgi:hypothetical protein
MVMINLDGSHEAWLIYSDWLEDQDDILCHQIRAELEDDIDNWIYDPYYYHGLNVGGVGHYVGGRRGGNKVGDCPVGGFQRGVKVGAGGLGRSVGGNHFGKLHD